MPRRTESAHGFRAITLCVVFLSLSVCFTEQAEGQGPDPAQVRQDYNHSVIIATEAHHQPGVFWAESTPPWTHSPYSPTGWVINPTTQRQRAIQIHSMADKITQIVNSAAITNELTGERGNAQFVEQRAAGGLQARSDLLLYKGARLMSKGAFEQAIEFYRQALISLEDKDRDKEGALYTQLGWASQAVGDLQGALSAYESALSAYGEKKNNSAKATTHLLIGSLYQSVGESMKAKDSYESALEEAQSDELRTAALASLGDLLQSIDTDESLTRYQQALTIVSKGSAWEASILAGIGRCWMEQSFKGNALVGPSNERVGEWVVDANGTHWKAIQKPNAIDDSLVEQIELTFAEAHASAKVSGNRSAEAGVLANIGELRYWRAVNAADARHTLTWLADAGKQYKRALRTMREFGDRTGEIGVLTNLGLVYDGLGESSKALRVYLEALRKMDELRATARLEEFRIDLSAQSSTLYQRAVDLEFELEKFDKAFDLSERSRSRAFLDQLARSQSGNRSDSPDLFSPKEESLRRDNLFLEMRLDEELAKPQADFSRERVRSLRTQLLAVRAEYEELLGHMNSASPEHESLALAVPMTLRSLQQEIPPDFTVISYFTTPEKTLAFIVTRRKWSAKELSVSELGLTREIELFSDFAGLNNSAATLAPLYEQLIAPIKTELRTKNLIIIPHGSLHALSFAALTTDGSRYLCDDYVISYLPSVSALSFLRARAKPYEGKILVVANDNQAGFAQLGQANREAQTVAALFKSEPLADDTAMSVFRKTAGDYDIVHLIAHVELDKQNFHFSRILLGHEQGSDAPLTFDDILRLNLGRTTLVVLSGCDSQMGKEIRGDDIFGPSRAFLAAGASSVIASLWSVDDEATEELMVAFYTHLRSGMSRAEALRAAQIETRQKYSHPFYWAAFTLAGDQGDSSIRLSKTPPPSVH